jgi:dihydroorotate dehydrogenase electron transfer subunit
LFVINSPVIETRQVQKNIYIQKIHSPKIAKVIKPGQFLNIRVSNGFFPLLRRPFSICDVEGENIFLMFNIMGEGTKILAKKNPGEMVDILGPLGNGFNLNGDFETAVIVAGGLGSAPFPFVTRILKKDKNLLSFVGGKTEDDVITYSLENISTSTDDGTKGYKGNVVELLQNNLGKIKSSNPKIFGCGPKAMLRSLKELCLAENLNCEVSTESAMACGFGICQGCPIESTSDSNKYMLICKDGPVFNVKDIVL